MLLITDATWLKTVPMLVRLLPQLVKHSTWELFYIGKKLNLQLLTAIEMFMKHLLCPLVLFFKLSHM